MSKKTIKDIDLKGKRVFVRCDFNVPMDENQNITDNRRIVAALPTIKYLIEQGCKIVLSSHLGRPKGEVKKEFSLRPVADELSRLLGKNVKLADDIIGESAKELTSNMKDGDIVLLENVRFDSREEAEERLNIVLEEELDTVRRECEMEPVVIAQDSGDAELIYTTKEKWEQALQDGNGQQRMFDAARYLIVEI